MYQRRDYYWKRVWFWFEVWTQNGIQHYRVGDMRFLSWRKAARVCNEIFAAYHEGRDAERRR